MVCVCVRCCHLIYRLDGIVAVGLAWFGLVWPGFWCLSILETYLQKLEQECRCILCTVCMKIDIM